MVLNQRFGSRFHAAGAWPCAPADRHAELWNPAYRFGSLSDMAQAPDPPPLDLTTETPLRVEEVAKLFGVHRKTVENWFSQGLAYVKIGRIRYTTREAIARFAQPGTQPLAPTAYDDAARRAQAATEAMRLRFGL